MTAPQDFIERFIIEWGKAVSATVLAAMHEAYCRIPLFGARGPNHEQKRFVEGAAFAENFLAVSPTGRTPEPPEIQHVTSFRVHKNRRIDEPGLQFMDFSEIERRVYADASTRVFGHADRQGKFEKLVDMGRPFKRNGPCDPRTGVADSLHGRCGACRRCHTDWDLVKYHPTTFTEDRGCFALCELCWSELTPPQRLAFYWRLHKDWLRDVESRQEYTRLWDDWRLIARAVLEGK